MRPVGSTSPAIPVPAAIGLVGPFVWRAVWVLELPAGAIVAAQTRLDDLMIVERVDEPGTGQQPIGEFLAELDNGGYTGAIGLEYRPSAGTDTALAWLPREQRG